MKLIVRAEEFNERRKFEVTKRRHGLTNYIIVTIKHHDGGNAVEFIEADNGFEYWVYAPNEHARNCMDRLFAWNIPFEFIRA